MRPLSRMVAIALMLACTTTAFAQESGSPHPWKFGMAGYLWGASITGTTATGGDIDIPFSDLIKNLDFGFMSALSARKDKWSFGSDFVYLNVSDDMSTTTDVFGTPVDVDVNIKLKGFVNTSIAGYSIVNTETFTFYAIGGVRYLWLRIKVDLLINPPPDSLFLNVSGSTWNGVVGFKGKATLSPKFFVDYYLDVGTGDNDFTVQTLGAIGYRLGKVSAIAGYRYLRWNFKGDNPGAGLFNDLVFSGPLLGVGFKF